MRHAVEPLQQGIAPIGRAAAEQHPVQQAQEPVLARLRQREAADRGADDALMLNTRGRLAEATVGNVFAVIDGVLVTPPAAEGALPGIARGLAIERLPVIERPVTVEELMRATEIAVTNSLGVRPVATLEDRPLEGRAAASELARVIGFA